VSELVYKPDSVLMVIYLDNMSPYCSSDLPEFTTSSCFEFLFGLASSGVYIALLVTKSSGKLLPHLFTLTQNGRLFSVALSMSSRSPGVTWHFAL
jgi:hypothetical protein